MPPPIRALLVAETVAVRRLLTDSLANEPGIEVAGTAANEKVALLKMATLRPDVVAIAPEKPGLAAMEMVRAIRQSHSQVPIIVIGDFSLPGNGAMRALVANGASACLPTLLEGEPGALGRSIRESLVPRMKTLCRQLPERPQRVDIVAIGISTGGPNALPVLLAGLPEDFPVPIVIVQHMPPVFTRQLAERLNVKCAISVMEAVAGEPLHPGGAWLAPGDFHLIVMPELTGARLELNREPHENSCRPSVDPLFRSVAAAYGPHVLGVIMTGMGRDGLSGCEAICKAGGQIIAQDQATSVVWGMPGSVVQAGLADSVLPLKALGSEIIRRVQFGRHPHATSFSHGS